MQQPATAFSYPALLFSRLWRAKGNARLVTAVSALIILFLRMPRAFFSPQLWGEDGLLLVQAHNVGWQSVFEPLGGTLVLYGRIVAILTSGLPLLIVPSFYFVAALAAILLVVYLAASPRFEIPYRWLAAIAIVLVPAGGEVLCALANTQWVLPIGLIVLLFSRPSESRTVQALEAAYVLVAAGSGPVGVFALPLFLWRTSISKDAERVRLSILSAVLLVVSVVQISTVATDLRVLDLIPSREYKYSLWLSIPLNWLGPFPRIGNTIGYGLLGAVVAVCIAAATIIYSFHQPYRFHKIAMVLLAGAILYGGMFKYRADLGTGYGFNPRYVFSGSVFFVWFLCIAFSMAKRGRNIIAAALATIFVNCLIVTFMRDRARTTDWPVALHLTNFGSDLTPIAPPGWFIRMGPDPWAVVIRNN